MRAMSALMRDAGMSTRVCLALTALRIRVSMSAIGSVIFCSQLSALELSASPAALCHTRDITLECQLAEAQTAQRELPHVGARAAAQTAAVAQPNLVFRRLLFLGNLGCCGHIILQGRGF